MPSAFGIPCGAAQQSALATVIDSNQQQLQGALAILLGPLGDYLQQQQQMLQTVAAALGRVANKQIVANNKAFDPTLAAIGNQVLGQLSTLTANYNAAMQAISAASQQSQPQPQQQPPQAAQLGPFARQPQHPQPLNQPVDPGTRVIKSFANPAVDQPIDITIDEPPADVVIDQTSSEPPSLPPKQDSLDQAADTAALQAQAAASNAAVVNQLVALGRVGPPQPGNIIPKAHSSWADYYPTIPQCNGEYIADGFFSQDYAQSLFPPTAGLTALASPGTAFPNFAQTTKLQFGKISTKQLGSGLLCPDFSTAFPDGLPLPGTADFCAVQQVLGDALKNLGTTVLDWLFENADVGHILDGLNAAIQGMDDGPLNAYVPIKKFLEGVSWLVDKARTVIDFLLDVIKCGLQASWQMLPKCNPAIVAGIQLVKSLVRTIEESEWGTDAVAWAVIKLSIDSTKINEYLDKLLNYYCPTETPSASEVTEAWVRGQISDELRDCLLLTNNIDPKQYLPFLYARGEKLSPEEAIEFVRRCGGNEQQEDIALRACGVVDPATRKALRSLYIEVPTIQDHLHWLQRQVFDKDYVERYKLMEGFTEKFWPTFGNDLTILGMQQKNAAYHYAAHWIQPSPTQMHEFVYRLRKGKLGVQNQFTPEDFERLLAEQDYAPLARKWFRETLYHIPALSYLRDMYRYRVITEGDLESYHQDLGYSPSDAARFVAVDKLVRAKIRANESHGWNPTAIGKAYAIGQLTRPQAEAKMTALGFFPDETEGTLERSETEFEYAILSRARGKVLSGTVTTVQQQIQLGLMSVSDGAADLQSLGWPQHQAEAVATMADAKRKAAIARKAISHLRSAFLAGEVDADYVREHLRLFGVVPDAVDGYVQVWLLELTIGRKRRAAAKVIDDVAEGLLTPEEAADRLLNLGYSDPDQMLYLADARKKLVTLDAEAEANRLMGGRFQGYQLGKIVTQTQKLSKRLVGDLKAHESPDKLQRWLIADVIDPAYFVERLTLYGFDCHNIDKRFDMAKLDQITNAESKKPKPNIGEQLIDHTWRCVDGKAVDTGAVNATRSGNPPTVPLPAGQALA